MWLAVTQLNHVTAQTNPFNAIFNVRFISNKGELISKIVRFAFYGQFQQIQQNHSACRHLADGRMEEHLKCCSVHTFLFLPCQLPYDILWQIPQPWKDLAEAFREGKCYSLCKRQRKSMKVEGCCLHGLRKDNQGWHLYYNFSHLFILKFSTIDVRSQYWSDFFLSCCVKTPF